MSRVTVDTSRLNRILRNLPGKTEDNNRAIAFRIEAGAKAKAPVDTGALRNSIYTVCGGQDGYAKASSDAHRANPKVETQPLPTPQGHDAHVGPSVEYGMPLEFGMSGRAARPFLVPAVREVERYLAAQWGNIADE